MNFLLFRKGFDVFWAGLQSALWQFQCPGSGDKLEMAGSEILKNVLTSQLNHGRMIWLILFRGGLFFFWFLDGCRELLSLEVPLLCKSLRRWGFLIDECRSRSESSFHSALMLLLRSLLVFSRWAALLVWCDLRCCNMQSALSHLSLSGVNYKAFAACTIASFQLCLVRLISETK